MTTVTGPTAPTSEPKDDATVTAGNGAAQTATVDGAQEAVDRLRQYLVLVAIPVAEVDGETVEDLWLSLGGFDGASPDEAISAAAAVMLERVGAGEYTFVAVAGRYFQPAAIAVSVAPKIEFVGR